MKRARWTAAGVAAALAWTLAPLLVFDKPGFDSRGFGNLPVLHSGRLKPLDTVARSSLLIISGRQTIAGERGLSAAEWLLDVVARPEKADRYPIFTIDHPDLLALADLPARASRRFSYSELRGAQRAIEQQAQAAEAVEPPQRSTFQEATLNLGERMDLYLRLKSTLWPPGQGSMTAGLASAGSPALLRFIAATAPVRPIPSADCSAEGFADVGTAELNARSGPTPPSAGAAAYARMHDAAAAGDPLGFNAALSDYGSRVASSCPKLTAWARREAVFNRVEPFYRGMGLYLAALLVLLGAWLLRSPELDRTAARLVLIAFCVHSAGLFFRTVLQGRPPVTNLYSSAVFVGWVAVGAGLIFERIYRRGLATLAAGVIGFATLIIAHHLAAQGDTMEMMRAVLDSNFWLTTHVVTITMGYGAGLLAAALAHVALIQRVLRRQDGWTTEDNAIVDMIYASLCACLVLSFVGTVLGGIWADRSWGRFWGWDPKENGALVIVLWNAMALHARWSGAIRQKGLVLMAILGGIVTSLAWFGVNMLGVGLHSYGFTGAAFYGLTSFVAAEVLIIAGSLAWLARPPAPRKA